MITLEIRAVPILIIYYRKIITLDQSGWFYSQPQLLHQKPKYQILIHIIIQYCMEKESNVKDKNYNQQSTQTQISQNQQLNSNQDNHSQIYRDTQILKNKKKSNFLSTKYEKLGLDESFQKDIPTNQQHPLLKQQFNQHQKINMQTNQRMNSNIFQEQTKIQLNNQNSIKSYKIIDNQEIIQVNLSEWVQRYSYNQTLENKRNTETNQKLTRRILQYKRAAKKIKHICIKKESLDQGVRNIQEQERLRKFSQDNRRIKVWRDYYNYQDVDYKLIISQFEIIVKAKLIEEQKFLDGKKHFSSGGFGKCYAVKEGEKLFCVKQMHLYLKENSLEFKAIQDVIAEVGICKLAGILGIGPTLYDIDGKDVVIDNNSAFFKMELCRRMKPNKQTESNEQIEPIPPITYIEIDKKKFQFDVRECMFTLHYLKMVHMDIKFQNIVFSEEKGKFLFCDFGLTRSVREFYNQKTYIKGNDVGGTFGYMEDSLQKFLNMTSAELRKLSREQKMFNLYLNDSNAVGECINSLQYYLRDYCIPKSKRNLSQKKKSQKYQSQVQKQLCFLKRVYVWNNFLQSKWQYWIQSKQEKENEDEKVAMNKYYKKVKKCFRNKRQFRQQNFIQNKMTPLGNQYGYFCHINSLEIFQNKKSAFKFHYQIMKSQKAMFDLNSLTQAIKIQQKQHAEVLDYVEIIGMIIRQEKQQLVVEKFLLLLSKSSDKLQTIQYCKQAAIFGARQYPILVDQIRNQMEEKEQLFTEAMFEFFLRIFLEITITFKTIHSQKYFEEAQLILNVIQSVNPKFVDIHPFVAVFYFFKAQILLKNNKDDKLIEEILQRSLKISKKYYGEQQRQYFQALMFLSHIKSRMGEQTKAEELRYEAISLAIQKYYYYQYPQLLQLLNNQQSSINESNQYLYHIFDKVDFKNNMEQKDEFMREIIQTTENAQVFNKQIKNGSYPTPLKANQILKWMIYHSGLFKFIYLGSFWMKYYQALMKYSTAHYSCFPKNCTKGEHCEGLLDFSCRFMHPNLFYLQVQIHKMMRQVKKYARFGL